MSKTYIWAAVVIIILIGGVWYVTQNNKAAAPATGASNFGTYRYECDEHVTFSMTPASDMTSIQLQPTGTSTYPPAVTVVQQTATSGVRYAGGGVVMTARGETVTLGEGNSAIHCSPVPSQTEAPFNFGD